jgi:alkanesulfonate monooxygenase SsuD/methylene tetrahydromethanopterin reductase-like flavin-dependent oxidoreductase (luciferase family)
MIDTPSGPRRLGAIFDRSRPPEQIADFARSAQELGADDLWFVEDLRWAGSVASAATALAATETLRVGIGIAPAPLRNPALLAMEIGAVARLHPGRLVAGLGHGATEWMREVGALVPNRLDLLSETTTALRAILRGEEVTVHGKAIHLDRMRLVHPPHQAPPVVHGVIGPRSLELSGRVADGTLVVEGRGPRDLPGIRALIDRGRAARGGAEAAGADRHEIIVFCDLVLDDDPARVQAASAPLRANLGPFLGVPEDEVFVAEGDAAAAAGHVRSLWEAGADTVVLRPAGDAPMQSLSRALAALRA